MKMFSFFISKYYITLLSYLPLCLSAHNEVHKQLTHILPRHKTHSLFATQRSSSYSAMTRYFMALLLMFTLNLSYQTTDIASISNTTECESDSAKDLFEDITYQDVSFDKALFVCTCAISITRLSSSNLLCSGLSNQVWQPPKL